MTLDIPVIILILLLKSMSQKRNRSCQRIQLTASDCRLMSGEGQETPWRKQCPVKWRPWEGSGQGKEHWREIPSGGRKLCRNLSYLHPIFAWSVVHSTCLPGICCKNAFLLLKSPGLVVQLWVFKFVTFLRVLSEYFRFFWGYCGCKDHSSSLGEHVPKLFSFNPLEIQCRGFFLSPTLRCSECMPTFMLVDWAKLCA